MDAEESLSYYYRMIDNFHYRKKKKKQATFSKNNKSVSLIVTINREIVTNNLPHEIDKIRHFVKIESILGYIQLSPCTI